MTINRRIKYICLHCSAGFSLIPAIEKFWYAPKSKGGQGWKSAGYHIIIYEDGTTWYLTKDNTYSTDVSKLDLSKISNGVLGFNPDLVNICYIGGVEKTNTSKAKDSRTDAQKNAIVNAIKLVQGLLAKDGQNISQIKIQGHRDFSPDKNGNGVIDSWERIKECPSFDAIPEYQFLIPTSSKKLLYTLANLNLREGAGTNFKTIGTPIPQGDSVSVIMTSGEWSRVQVTKDNRIGWVSSKYLR